MRLKTLGGLALEGSDFNRAKPLLLLSYLALEGPTSRRELSDLFFSGAKDRRDSLSTALRYLRRVSDGLVVTRGKAVATAVSCDARDVLMLFDGGQHEAAYALYEGAFLKGVDLSLGAELEEWVFATREVLAERIRTACLDLAELRLHEGSRREALRFVDAAVALAGAPELEPDDMRRLYPLLVATESTHAAKVRAEAEAFGLDLTSDVTPSLQERPAGRSVGAWRLLHTSFVGRRAELAHLTELFDRPDVRLVTLLGPGGVGKSRLAGQLAAGFGTSRRFPDGVHFVALEGLNAASQVPTAIASALGIDGPSRPDPVQQLCHGLQGRACLLVLDNYEHVIDASHVPVALLAASPELRVVVTSRQRLGVEEEFLVQVEGLRTAVPGTRLSEAAGADAIRLFDERARKVRSQFRLTDATLPSVQRICEHLQGNALAIELAAAWVRVMPVDEIAEEIERDLDVLTSTSRNVPERHRSMRAVLEQTWSRLSSREQSVLARLAVFRGGFRRDAAADVADATLLMLARFTDASLLRAPDGRRYEAHPLLVQFAQERLDSDPAEKRAVELRHGSYVERVLQRCASRMRSFDTERALTEVDAEIHDVAAAMQRAHDAGRTRDLMAMARSLWLDVGYYTFRGPDTYALAMLVEAAQAAEGLDERGPAHDLFGKLGDAYQTALGDLDRALNAYGRAIELARSAENFGREAVFVSLYGLVRRRQGRDDAEAYLERAERIARDTADDTSLCAVLEQRGHVLALEQRWAEARQLFRESLDVVARLERQGDVPAAEVARRRFFALVNLGEPEHRLGRFEEALDARARALEIAEACGNPIWTAHALAELGQMLHAAGRSEEAASRLLRALDLYERHRLHAHVASLKAFMAPAGYPTTGDGSPGTKPPFDAKAVSPSPVLAGSPPSAGGPDERGGSRRE